MLFTLSLSQLSCFWWRKGEHFVINYSHALYFCFFAAHFPTPKVFTSNYASSKIINVIFYGGRFFTLIRSVSISLRHSTHTIHIANEKCKKRFHFHKNRNTLDQRSQPRSFPNFCLRFANYLNILIIFLCLSNGWKVEKICTALLNKTIYKFREKFKSDFWFFSQ